MNAADKSVLREIVLAAGYQIWDRNAAVRVQRKNGMNVWRRTPPPEGALKRLTELGFVEVATHTISVWKYGPRDVYLRTAYGSPEWKAAVKENVALLNEMDNPTLKSRVEVHAKATDRGIRFALEEGLLD